MATPPTLSINIPNYSNSNRTPGVFFGLDPSGANTATPLQQTLLIGQMLAAGTATPNVPIIATSLPQVQALCGGPGAMLSLMYKSYLADDNFGTVTILPVSDNAGGVAATATVTVTGTATGAGTLALYVGGQAVSVAVAVGDTPTVVATNIVAAAALVPSLPATCTNTAGVVTFTARHKGAAAGDLTLYINIHGSIGGETTPAGLTVALATGTVGTTNPVLTTALANLGDTPYQFICCPYTDSTSLAAVQALLSDTTGTWNPLSNTGGGVFSAFKGSFATISTFGLTNNYQHISVLGINDSPTPVYQVAANYCAECAFSLRIDPSLPLKDVVMSGILAPANQANRFTRSQRNTLLYSGIATMKISQANQVVLERAITTYQSNTQGVPDDSYIQVETLYTIQSVINLWKAAFTTKYARVKLVDNGITIIPGANTVNPNSIKAEVIAQYQIAVNQGLCQQVAAFVANVNVQKISPYQVNIYAPVIIADQLFTIGVDLAFSK